jgi:hypothetical protein
LDTVAFPLPVEQFRDGFNTAGPVLTVGMERRGLVEAAISG